MGIPEIMGCPLWFGRIKRRVAKKYLGHGIGFRNKAFLKLMSNIDIGDLVQDCSMYNVRIADIEPKYRRVGKGFVLYDIDITNDKGGSCSYRHCGVEPALTRAQIFERVEEYKKYWDSSGDSWNFSKRLEFTTVHEDGTATFDYAGYNAKYPEK